MASEINTYKCPSCGAPLRYDGKTEKLVCDYCDNSYELSLFESSQESKENAEKNSPDSSGESWKTENAGSSWGEDADSLKNYSCPSCGAELFCTETTAATNCPYCGNPVILAEQFSERKKPDYILPFKLSKKEAIAALQSHYKGKFLLPDTFTKKNHLEEIKGVYVPFWLFDANVDGSMTFDATNSHSYRDGDYIVTKTSYYNIYREGNLSFQKVPVDGSTSMPDDYMDSIEPYDYESLQKFSTTYLPGFLADQYDVDAQTASQRARTRCISSMENCLRDTVSGYGTVSVSNRQLHLHPEKTSYALMPVWLLTTKWKDKNYLFAMNGQTGKMVGDLPVDKSKWHKTFWSTFLGLGIILSLFFSGPIGSWLTGLF